MDNARYQHCQSVLDKAKGLNIEILFLPPYSPNLNIIERLWKFTKKKVLYGKFYENPDLFHKTIRTFFEQINQKYHLELESLLTLKFQIIKNINAQKVAA
jgi:transposase